MKTHNEIRVELVDLFPEVFKKSEHQQFLNDCSFIASFLSGLRPETRLLLEKLDNEMVDEMFDKLGVDYSSRAKQQHVLAASAQFRKSKKRLGDPERGLGNKIASYSRLLTTVLSRAEARSGFSLSWDDKFHPSVPLIYPLNAPQFRKQILAQRRPFKDPTIGADHGEYTHRIQWYLVVQGLALSEPVGLIYEKIGSIGWQKDDNFGLWDAICDRQPPGAPGLPTEFPFYKEDSHDFRTPEALLSWLCEDTQQKSFPLLASFLKARKEKRQLIIGDATLEENYLSRKIFGRPLKDLNPAQRGEIYSYFQDHIHDLAKRDENSLKGILEPISGGRYRM